MVAATLIWCQNLAHFSPRSIWKCLYTRLCALRTLHIWGQDAVLSPAWPHYPCRPHAGSGTLGYRWRRGWKSTCVRHAAWDSVSCDSWELRNSLLHQWGARVGNPPSGPHQAWLPAQQGHSEPHPPPACPAPLCLDRVWAQGSVQGTVHRATLLQDDGR